MAYLQAMTHQNDKHHRAFKSMPDGFRWESVEHKPYKEDERTLFADISRQTLFSRPDLAGELRYFEVAAGGYSTLERHEHVHAVLILRGGGQALVGDRVFTLGQNDLVTVPPMTWHQFRADAEQALGFLCMVDAVRDKPQLPSEADLAGLMSDPAVAKFFGSGTLSAK
jgi:quercetin dioxygenase-like cupin family protein